MISKSTLNTKKWEDSFLYTTELMQKRLYPIVYLAAVNFKLSIDMKNPFLQAAIPPTKKLLSVLKPLKKAMIPIICHFGQQETLLKVPYLGSLFNLTIIWLLIWWMFVIIPHNLIKHPKSSMSHFPTLMRKENILKLDLIRKDLMNLN